MKARLTHRPGAQCDWWLRASPEHNVNHLGDKDHFCGQKLPQLECLQCVLWIIQSNGVIDVLKPL